MLRVLRDDIFEHEPTRLIVPNIELVWETEVGHRACFHIAKVVLDIHFSDIDLAVPGVSKGNLFY